MCSNCPLHEFPVSFWLVRYCRVVAPPPPPTGLWIISLSSLKISLWLFKPLTAATSRTFWWLHNYGCRGRTRLAHLVILRLVCPQEERNLLAWKPVAARLSPGIRVGWHHRERRARNRSDLQTNKMLFWARGDFVQMSLEALVIVETAAGAHGLSSKKHNVLKQHMSNMNRPYIRNPNRNTPTLL